MEQRDLKSFPAPYDPESVGMERDQIGTARLSRRRHSEVSRLVARDT